MRLAIAHRGFVHLEVETDGPRGARLAARSRHRRDREDGPRPRRASRSSIVGLRADPTHPYLGSGSVHASLIEGGQEFSSYPARCVLQAERRTIPGETAELAERELREIVAQRRRGRSRLLGRGSVLDLARARSRCSEDAEIVQLVRRHATAVLGRRAGRRRRPVLGGLGAARRRRHPDGRSSARRGEGLHSEVEWVDVASLERCVEIYTAVAAELCG